MSAASRYDHGLFRSRLVPHRALRPSCERCTLPFSLIFTRARRLVVAQPAPAGRWLLMGRTDDLDIPLALAHGTVDADYPFACSAGLVGGTTADDQAGPQCRDSCPAGVLRTSASPSAEYPMLVMSTLLPSVRLRRVVLSRGHYYAHTLVSSDA